MPWPPKLSTKHRTHRLTLQPRPPPTLGRRLAYNELNESQFPFGLRLKAAAVLVPRSPFLLPPPPLTHSLCPLACPLGAFFILAPLQQMQILQRKMKTSRKTLVARRRSRRRTTTTTTSSCRIPRRAASIASVYVCLCHSPAPRFADSSSDSI